jgi:hypothetical protein
MPGSGCTSSRSSSWRPQGSRWPWPRGASWPRPGSYGSPRGVGRGDRCCRGERRVAGGPSGAVIVRSGWVPSGRNLGVGLGPHAEAIQRTCPIDRFGCCMGVRSVARDPRRRRRRPRDVPCPASRGAAVAPTMDGDADDGRAPAGDRPGDRRLYFDRRGPTCSVGDSTRPPRATCGRASDSSSTIWLGSDRSFGPLRDVRP